MLKIGMGNDDNRKIPNLRVPQTAPRMGLFASQDMSACLPAMGFLMHNDYKSSGVVRDAHQEATPP